MGRRTGGGHLSTGQENNVQKKKRKKDDVIPSEVLRLLTLVVNLILPSLGSTKPETDVTEDSCTAKRDGDTEGKQ